MNNQKSTELYLTFLVVGDTSVGKTSLIIRYVHGNFEEANILKKTLNCTSLLKNDTIKEIFIENQFVQLQIVNQLVNFSMTCQVQRNIFLLIELAGIKIDRIRKAQGILIVYDITNRYSFNSIQLWIAKTDNIANFGVVRILIGNKCDENDNRAVTFEEGNLLAQQYGIPFFETSAKQSINVENSFLFVARLILEEQQQNVNLKNYENNFQLNVKLKKQSKNTKSCI